MLGQPVENENPFAEKEPLKMAPVAPPKMAPVAPPKKLVNPFEQAIQDQKEKDAELERKKLELKRKADLAAKERKEKMELAAKEKADQDAQAKIEAEERAK